MKLLRIELNGFKSFADRAELHFDAGATVIVGPNGCGKSNIVDAFRWVLGEQSAKSLRGGGMQDVIFNGSDGRKPAGLAEVILTFDNSDGRLAVEQQEVSVGRRLYRDGTSEYLLNRQVVRLRDIRELFMDTGVGVDAYSVVEQGKVDQVLASNTVERRAIFEEAAGISRYRARRREAARKLERVEQNLLRLADIAGEVDRRLRTIKAAATKARNYRELSQRLRELRLSHFVWEYHRLSDQLTEASRTVSSAESAVASAGRRQADAQLRQQELDDRQIRLASELAEVEQRLIQAASMVANHRDRMAFAADRERELTEELFRRRHVLANLRRRMTELAEQDRGLTRSAEELDSSAEAARSRIEALNRDQHASETEMHELSDRLTGANESLFELVRLSSHLTNQVNQYKTVGEQLAGQRGRLAARSAELDGQFAQRTAEQGKLRNELSACEADLAELHSRLERLRAEAEAKDAAARELAGRLAAMKERRSAVTARRDLLAAQEQRLEGITDGPRTVLELQAEHDKAPSDHPGEQSADRPHIDGLVGLVADLLMAAPADEPARQAENSQLLELVLGDREQHLVVRRGDALQAAAARAALDRLSGPAHFVCLDRLGQVKPDLSSWLGRAGVVGPVSDLVLCEPVFFPVRDALVGWMVLVETAEDAMRLAGEAAATDRVQFVTRAGQIVTADGRVTVIPTCRVQGADGQQPCGSALSLVGRKAELRELNRQLEGLGGAVAQLESELAAASAEAVELDRARQELRSRTQERSAERVDIAARLRQAEHQADAVRAEQSLIAAEQADLGQRLERAADGQKAAAEKLAELEQRRAAVCRQVEELTGRLQQGRAGMDRLNQTLTEARVALGQAEERRRAVREQLAALRRTIEEARAQQATSASDCRSLRQRIEQNVQTQLESESAIADLHLHSQMLTEQRQDLSGKSAEVRSALAEVESALTSAGHELRAAEQTLHQAQVTQNELRVRQEDLVGRVADEHQIDLAELHRSSPPPTDGAAVNWAAVEAEIADLRGRIERLGNVNLEAIEEQEQLEARSAFLHRQLEDVLSAKRQLESIIERINAESRRRFETTFEQVREHFRELFRKLFGGGKADLVLENPDDLLESGIEIIARPPGKELRSISLLSGGEKTLTALALLLAVFRSRPSPFCILDEVDAALDESNNDRFNQLINEFLQFSQFLIITHSKRTMTIADVLYGVTMQEQGVSRQVAVRFDGKTVRSAEGEDLAEPQAAVA